MANSRTTTTRKSGCQKWKKKNSDVKTQNANSPKWSGNKIEGLLETDKIVRRFCSDVSFRFVWQIRFGRIFYCHAFVFFLFCPSKCFLFFFLSYVFFKPVKRQTYIIILPRKYFMYQEKKKLKMCDYK